ncbi:MAG TPA: CBS domain-containing protein [Polyangiaceae bacterium]
MRISDVMTYDPIRCFPDDTLNRAAQLLWEHDVGVLPVTNGLRRLVGIITDRDICMAAYTQGRPLAEIQVSTVCSKHVISCRQDESLEAAERLMRQYNIRRLAVVDRDETLTGVLSLSDLVRHLTLVGDGDGRSNGLDPVDISLTLEAVSRPRNSHMELIGPERAAT